MKDYTVTCIEQLPSGNWRVQAATGKPFVLMSIGKTWGTPLVIWMREPHPGRTVTIKLSDCRALRHRQLVGDVAYEANQRRLRAKRAAGDPKTLDRRFRQSRGSLGLLELCVEKHVETPEQRAEMLARVRSVTHQRILGGEAWVGRDWHGRVMGVVTEDEAVQIAARLENGRTVAL